MEPKSTNYYEYDGSSYDLRGINRSAQVYSTIGPSGTAYFSAEQVNNPSFDAYFGGDQTDNYDRHKNHPSEKNLQPSNNDQKHIRLSYQQRSVNSDLFDSLSRRDDSWERLDEL